MEPVMRKSATMRRFMLLVVLLMATSGWHAESRTGTLQGCGSPVQSTFRKASAWRAGIYRVEVAAVGTRASCEVQLPLAGCQGEVPCVGLPAWSMELSGCALPSDNGAITG